MENHYLVFHSANPLIQLNAVTQKTQQEMVALLIGEGKLRIRISVKKLNH
jgi:hypothetical protein